jgi:hypothetical protein
LLQNPKVSRLFSSKEFFILTVWFAMFGVCGVCGGNIAEALSIVRRRSGESVEDMLPGVSS